MGEQAEYVAVTGDLVASARLPRAERSEVQRRVLDALRECNAYFQNEVAVPFAITLGDEFQGLVSDAGASLDVVEFLCRGLYPQAARFGIGIGGLATPLEKTTALMDGEPFQRSRAALDAAKKENTPIRYQTDDRFLDLAVNGMLDLVAAIQERWQPLHYQRFWLYKELGELKKVAEREGVAPASVGQSLQTAGYRAVLSAQGTLKELLGMGRARASH